MSFQTVEALVEKTFHLVNVDLLFLFTQVSLFLKLFHPYFEVGFLQSLSLRELLLQCEEMLLLKCNVELLKPKREVLGKEPLSIDLD